MRRTFRDRGATATARAVLALLLLGSAAAAATADDEVRLLVEVRDAKGRTVTGLDPTELAVTDGGVAVEPVATADAAGRPPARIVLYFDRALASSRAVKRGAEALAELARPLVELGEVELVFADEVPELALRSRDELILGERLARAALADAGRDRALEIRRQTLRELGSTAAALGPDAAAERVSAAIEEELELIAERQRQLVAWLAAGGGPGDEDAPAPGARILIPVLDGFDLDPVGFYLQHLDEDLTRPVVRGATRLGTLEETVRETARTLSALGWTVLPLAVAPAGGRSGLALDPIEVPVNAQGETTVAPGVTVRPGELFGRRKRADAPVEPAYLAPRAPLDLLAAETGGEVATAGAGLRDALARLGQRVELRWRAPGPLDGRLRAVEVRALRPNLTARGRRWVSRGTPATLSDLRLRRLLAGIETAGGLDPAAVLRLGDAPGAPAELAVRLDAPELESAGPLRVSLAIATAAGEPRIEREVATPAATGEWIWRKDLALPAAAEVAVLVEDLATGTWGGRRATVIESELAAADARPRRTVIELVPPEREVVRGRVRFETRVQDPAVAAVEFRLDERPVERVERPPYSARLDLGRTPRRQVLTAIAYDARDAELGRDTLILNGGGSGLGVEIVRPARARGTGYVEFEAEVSVPAERRLDRVLFFWNSTPVATLFAPPFAQRVFIPPEKPLGYVRVVAMVDDGTVAEDVVLMNGPDHGERLEVNLVELYVVVTDEAGRPVRGLERADFRVREDGVVQEIAAFSDASDLPLTLGMAIDSSASMFVKLPRVQQAAIQFLRSTWSERDRAFVVDFDSEPRLARGMTDSLERIERSIDALEADGRTALWESIVFSLVQLQGVRGRKALVVYSDGADEDDQFPFRSSIAVAKEMGVPIYLILMKRRPEKEPGGLSLLTRSFTSRVNRLVEATGGRVFYAREYRNLGEVYAQIEDELRSQYLLAYYPKPPSRGETWREIEIDVRGDGLRPRTLTGYTP